MDLETGFVIVLVGAHFTTFGEAELVLIFG